MKILKAKIFINLQEIYKKYIDEMKSINEIYKNIF